MTRRGHLIDWYQRVYRYDDVSINSNRDHTLHIMDAISSCDTKTHCHLMCVSPLVDNSPSTVKAGRVFPSIFNAYSDKSIFYRMQGLGLPAPISGAHVIPASHGLIHVDHRLLTYDAQEMSIVTSCNLVDSDIFVPPFNKWNQDTQQICEKHNILLIKWEHGWRCIEHSLDLPISATNLWYMHDRELTAAQIIKWFQQ